MRNTPRNKNQNKKRDGSGDSADRLRDLPQWLEEFTDNLEDTEVPAPAHISQDSDSEYPTTVATTSSKHSIFPHFPKDRNCKVCLRTKMTGAPCRRRTGEAVPRAEKFGNLTTADHQVLDEEGESGNNHRYAVVVHDLATRIDSILSVQNQNVTGDGIEFTKVPRAVGKAESHLH